MYNAKIKNKYIEQYLFSSNTLAEEKQKKWLINFFNRIGKIEKDLETDIADADFETAMLMFGLFGKTRLKTTQTNLTLLRNYVDWYIKSTNTINTENKLDSIKCSSIDKTFLYRITMLKDEQQLIDFIETSFRCMEDRTIDIIYVIYALLIYAGVKPQFIKFLKVEDINFKTKILTFKNIDIKLSDYTLKNINCLCDMNEFNYITVTEGKEIFHVRKKANTGHLLETSSEDRKNIDNYFRQALNKAVKLYRNAKGAQRVLTSFDIYKSGIFYRIYENEYRSSQICLDEMYKYDPEPSNKAELYKRNSSNGALLEEYKQWKKAFYESI